MDLELFKFMTIGHSRLLPAELFPAPDIRIGTGGPDRVRDHANAAQMYQYKEHERSSSDP